MGDDSSTWTISADTNIKAINPNVPINVSLVNQQKILLRKLSGVLNFILKNNLICGSYTSLIPNKIVYLYKYNVSGRKIVCGIILLKMCFNVMKSQLVIDRHLKEKEIEALPLIGCRNNVRTFLTSTEEKRNEINSLLPGKE